MHKINAVEVFFIMTVRELENLYLKRLKKAL